MTWRRRCLRWALIACVSLALAWIGERCLDWWSPFPREVLRPYASTRILSDAHGQELRWHDPADGERRRWVPLDRISPWVIRAVIASEDARFHQHSGVDGLAVLRALGVNLWSGRRTSGASTITMQVARLCEPGARTWSNKMREALRARQLERLLSKDAILEQYCNRAPWGGRLRGIEAASRTWFAKSASDLGPAEAAMLVAMLPAPSRRSPTGDSALLQRRRDALLAKLVQGDDLVRACAEPLPLQARSFPWLAPHACDAALAAAPVHGDLTLSLRLDDQRRIEAAVAQQHSDIDGLAVISLDHDGSVLAHLGSRAWRDQPFDAARGLRSAGSTLKPFLYRRALAEDVLTITSAVHDQRRDYADWIPANEDERYLGTMPLAEALWRSRNPPAVAALVSLGLPRFQDELLGAGLDLRVSGLDASLGSSSTSPFALAQAYAHLARQAQQDTAAAQVLDALRRVPLAIALDAVAWKTGTSSDRRDAWCAAVDADRIVVVWLGWLDGRSDARLRGRGMARELCAQVLAALRS